MFDEQEQFERQMRLQEESNEQNQAMYVPQLRETIGQAQGVIIAQTNPKLVVTDILREFQGFEEDENGEWKQVNYPIMNSLGIRKIKSILRPLMNDSIRWGRLKESQVKNFTLSVIYSLINDLASHWREYGISDKFTSDYIVKTLRTSIYTMLSRAEDQNEKNWIGRVSFENVTDPNRYGKKKSDSSFLDKFKF